MPGFDRSGPFGEGPMTGGARGLCNPAVRGNRVFGGYGWGRGAGPRRGFRRRGFGPGFGPGSGWGASGYSVYPEDTTGEVNALKEQADSIQQALDAINQKIAEMEKAPE